MRILYVHQYFITPAQPGGTRSYEMAKFLLARGHEVTMITSGLDNPEHPVRPGEAFSEYDCEGIRVVAVPGGYNDARMGTAMPGWKRMLKFFEFARVAAAIGRDLPAPEIVFATHTPLTVGLAGIKLSRRFDVPFVFEVRDLWPDALINIGAVKNPLVIWYLRRMERKIYRSADHIVALSPGMKNGIVRQGPSESSVTVIPNASDLEMFSPDLDGSDQRARLGLGDRFAAIYFGAMGLANGLDYVLDAAEHLKARNRNDIVFVLHGDGGCKDDLERRAARRRLDNVVFSNPTPRKADMARIVAGCDACMTIYKATREVTWSPNKMFDALAAGKPVLINVGEWVGETIESNQCGRQVSPEHPEQLADAAIELADNPDMRRQMGENSRRLAENEFDREQLAGRLENVLIGCLSRAPG